MWGVLSARHLQQELHRVAVVGVVVECRALGAAEVGAARMGHAPAHHALQLVVVGREPRFRFGGRVVIGVMYATQLARKLPALGEHGSVQVAIGRAGHREQRPGLAVVVAVFGVVRRGPQRGHVSPRQEEQRHAAAPEARVGEQVVGQSGQVGFRLLAREHGCRVAAAAQQRGDARIARAEVAVGVVAARGDHGIGFGVVAREGHGCLGVDFEQQAHDVFRQHAVLGRGLHEAAVSGRHHAQQVEESDQRNVARHDDQHVGATCDGKRVAFEPRGEPGAVEHVGAQRIHGPPDFGGREPGICGAGPGDDCGRVRIVAECRQPVAQRRE